MEVVMHRKSGTQNNVRLQRCAGLQEVSDYRSFTVLRVI